MPGFDLNELFVRFRIPLFIFLAGVTLITGGIFVYRSGILSAGTKVEVINESNAGPDLHQGDGLTVEIAGEVLKPGVYKLPQTGRVDDLLIAAGGFSVGADRNWTDKYLNRAAKLTDGQKVFIPSINNQSNDMSANKVLGDQTVSSPIVIQGSVPFNINTASLTELDSLPGIGPVYGQNIIEHRPYSTIEELVTRGAIKQSLFNKIKDMISVY